MRKKLLLYLLTHKTSHIRLEQRILSTGTHRKQFQRLVTPAQDNNNAAAQRAKVPFSFRQKTLTPGCWAHTLRWLQGMEVMKRQ